MILTLMALPMSSHASVEFSNCPIHNFTLREKFPNTEFFHTALMLKKDKVAKVA